MKKSLDCVKLMRDIRSKLSRRDATRPELLEQDMTEVRRKYGFPQPARRPKAHLVAEMPAEYRTRKHP